jgi:enoyl-[acyl-carrier-protein] reductase (NADH)
MFKGRQLLQTEESCRACDLIESSPRNTISRDLYGGFVMNGVSPFDLDGKTAIVTGGGQGIGEATVKFLVELGANVIVNDIADDKLKDLKNTNDTIAVSGSVTNENDVKNVVSKAIESFGRIDILVNNAGTVQDSQVKDMWFPFSISFFSVPTTTSSLPSII